MFCSHSSDNLASYGTAAKLDSDGEPGACKARALIGSAHITQSPIVQEVLLLAPFTERLLIQREAAVFVLQSIKTDSKKLFRFYYDEQIFCS